MSLVTLQKENVRAALREFKRTLELVNYLSTVFSDFDSARKYYEDRVEEMENQLKKVSE